MTLSKSYLVGLTDIRALRITCTHCKGALSLPLDRKARVHEQCPICDFNQLFQSSGAEQQAIETLLSTLIMLKESKLKSSTVSIEVEQASP